MQLSKTTKDSLSFILDLIEKANFSESIKNTVYFTIDKYLTSIGIEKLFEHIKGYSEYNKNICDYLMYGCNMGKLSQSSICKCENKDKLKNADCSEFVYLYDKIDFKSEDKIAFVKTKLNHFNYSSPSHVAFHMLFEDKDEAVNSLLKSHGFNENSYMYVSYSNFNIKSINNIYNKLGKGKFVNLNGFVCGDFFSEESILERIDIRQLTVDTFNDSFFYMFLLYKEGKINQLNQFIITMLNKFEHHISSTQNIRMPFLSARIGFIVYFSNCLDSNAKNEIYSRIVNLSIVPPGYTGDTHYRSEYSLFILIKSIIDLEVNPDSF